jgi:hypothetical protein
VHVRSQPKRVASGEIVTVGKPDLPSQGEQATPRPWKIRVEKDGTVMIVHGRYGHLIAVESVGREDAARTMADAELIVAAVNAYEGTS